jgi:hypothetical protein
MPGADELTLPKDVIHKKLYASKLSTIFLKENLYNIAASSLDYPKFIFLDGDIIFDRPDWLDSCSALLDEYDIIQPFERCYWMQKDNQSFELSEKPDKPVLTRESVAKCLHYKMPPKPGDYHPGFAWGMTKNYFNKIGGFYEEHVVGGGDISLWYALDTYSDKDYKDFIQLWKKNNHRFFRTNKFKEYEKLILNNEPKIGYLSDCIVYHLYHGTRRNRQYTTRYNYVPVLDNSGDYPLTKNIDGLLEWTDSEYAELCLQLFLNRREDD